MNTKPFIHTLKSPTGWYMYEVNRNETIEIDEDAYQYLNAVESNKEYPISEITKLKITKLIEQGYLSTKRPKKIEHPETKWLSYHYERNIQRMTLQVTQNCNLRCSYCVYSNDNYDQRSHSKKRMSLDTAKNAIDFYLKHSIDAVKPDIGFYGGEPLLEYGLIKQIVEYIKETAPDRDISFGMTTNGTLLNCEMIEFFQEYDFKILISLDGPKCVHDQDRRFAANGQGSYDVIIEKLELIAEKYPDFLDNIGINSVVNPDNDYNTINSLFDDKDELKSIRRTTSLIDDVFSIEKTISSYDYIENINYDTFLGLLNLINRVSIDKVSSMGLYKAKDVMRKCEKNDIQESFNDITAPGGPCVPARRKMFVDIDGNIFPCERVSEASDAMKIGDIYKGIKTDKARDLLNIGTLTKEKCTNCWAFIKCTVCCKHADNGSKLDREIKLSHCVQIRRQAEEELLDNIMLDAFAKLK